MSVWGGRSFSRPRRLDRDFETHQALSYRFDHTFRPITHACFHVRPSERRAELRIVRQPNIFRIEKVDQE
jgi:hypothetical protein